MGESEKRVRIEDLIGPGPKTKEILVRGMKVKIRSLTVGDLAAIAEFNRKKGYGDNPFYSAMGMVLRGLIEPKANWDQVCAMDMELINTLLAEITELSGWTREAGEEIRNLSKPMIEPI